MIIQSHQQYVRWVSSTNDSNISAGSHQAPGKGKHLQVIKFFLVVLGKSGPLDIEAKDESAPDGIRIATLERLVT